jgi:hypothetical protein
MLLFTPEPPRILFTGMPSFFFTVFGGMVVVYRGVFLVHWSRFCLGCNGLGNFTGVHCDFPLFKTALPLIFNDCV